MMLLHYKGNNLEFFAKSKNADKFRQDVEAKFN
jgi:hypothetical protein